MQCGGDAAEAMHARDLGQYPRHAVEPVERGDDHGDNGGGDADHHDRHGRQAENRDQHRIEDEDRNRVISGEERIECLAHARQRMDDQPGAKPSTMEMATTSAMMPSVRSISAVIAPEASSVHSALAISDGGMMTRG